MPIIFGCRLGRVGETHRLAELTKATPNTQEPAGVEALVHSTVIAMPLLTRRLCAVHLSTDPLLLLMDASPACHTVAPHDTQDGDVTAPGH